jgi:hypothetical protein
VRLSSLPPQNESLRSSLSPLPHLDDVLGEDHFLLADEGRVAYRKFKRYFANDHCCFSRDIPPSTPVELGVRIGRT